MADAISSTSFLKLSAARGAGAAAVFLLGWLSLYGPVYVDFANGAWQRDENAHAPFIIGICLAALWVRVSTPTFQYSATRAEFLAGVMVVASGLALFLMGRAGEVVLALSASQVIVAAGTALALFGVAGLRHLWFPIALSVYLIVWPGWALELITSPLKRLVSEVVSNGLYAAGLPVANAGAVIAAGPYQLLVADACAGLNSLIALTAIGAVYLYMVKRNSYAVNAAVLLSLIPLAIAANIVRVALLVLVTYFLGYDAGQSFLHVGAGIVMFAFALLGVFIVDALAAYFWERRS